jgi:glutamate dehydrogenase (NADP+)
MLAAQGEGFEGTSCLLSGSGNVAQFTAEKLLELGARVVTLSDSDGFVHDPDGLDPEKLAWVKVLKNERRGRIAEYADRYAMATHHPHRPDGANPLWDVPADFAFPCASQNEISEVDAAHLVANGIRLVVEGSNMATVSAGVDRLLDAGVLFAPSKAANAGGVAVSGLEMAQDMQLYQWTADEVDLRLRTIMTRVYDNVCRTAERYGHPGNFVLGANIAGFVKVADAMLDESPI